MDRLRSARRTARPRAGDALRRPYDDVITRCDEYYEAGLCIIMDYLNMGNTYEDLFLTRNRANLWCRGYFGTEDFPACYPEQVLLQHPRLFDNNVPSWRRLEAGVESSDDDGGGNNEDDVGGNNDDDGGGGGGGEEEVVLPKRNTGTVSTCCCLDTQEAVSASSSAVPEEMPEQAIGSSPLFSESHSLRRDSVTDCSFNPESDPSQTNDKVAFSSHRSRDVMPQDKVAGFPILGKQHAMPQGSVVSLQVGDTGEQDIVSFPSYSEPSLLEDEVMQTVLDRIEADESETDDHDVYDNDYNIDNNNGQGDDEHMHAGRTPQIRIRDIRPTVIMFHVPEILVQLAKMDVVELLAAE